MGSFEPLIAPIADDHLRAKGAVRHEPCARLVARMFTFWAKKIAYCIAWNSGLLVELRRVVGAVPKAPTTLITEPPPLSHRSTLIGQEPDPATRFA
ncbi:hypothetical protein CDO30_20185 (plasmid) [Sinorhizobium meliloti]|uniref:Uncharacterized protein n=1 Tax=Rhizobium meliloti (strain 1021) TaxID=266834 RepID=Q92ZZ7_RHIME|nr:hypothetical protein SMa0575 [Sinorhizobium meliloti 1021]AGG69991.1 Hypothetical protein SM2011_a0575 [Sinorhizobium meliloti 2011]ASP60601.1 hypothetical protein CDO30_20185 [Sinorhizobium meliloti]MDW9614632.1 hypothetical protein [Sinorhizobium meliloti]MDW9837296.1 hypothetical protein [Sinorhizobium meliloti]